MSTNTHTPLSARVADFRGKPTLLINETPTYPMIYSLTDCPGGRWTWEEFPRRNITMFAEQGITLFQVDLWFEHLFTAEGTLDISLACKQLRGVLDICPTAAIFIRLHVNATPEWNRQHRDECTEYADIAVDESEVWGLHRPLDNDETNSLRNSLASLKWREEATRQLQEFCQQLAATPEGDALAGIHIACGVFGEWHYWGFNSHEPDTGKAMTTYFRRWLQRKYEHEKALQAAWNDPSVTFETAMVPSVEERKVTSDGIFRDPRTQQKTIDYYECQHEVVAEDIIHFCRVAKESWPRPLVTGTFYGYFFMLFGRQAAGGHLQMERVLNSPYVDYLSAPMSYQSYAREVGGAGHSRGLLDVARFHHKLWLDEMDQASHLGGPNSQSFKTDLIDDIAIIRRNVAYSYTRGMGLWFYDFGPHLVSGWWDQPVLLKEIKQLREIFSRAMEKPYRRDADVLVVYDTDCFYHLGYTWIVDCVSHTAVDELTSEVYHSGAIFDEALLIDLEHINWDNYRTVIFANTFLLTERQKQFVHERVARNGRHLIWNYMPGYSDGKRLDPHSVSEVVGMELEKKICSFKPEVVISQPPFGHTRFSVWNPVPLFVIKDSAATAFGYLDRSYETAFASKQLAESTSWFCSLPLHGPSVMREIFRRSGAHIYNEDGDVIHIGGGILCLHTKTGGKRRLTLHNGKQVEVEVAPRSTTLLDSETGQILLQ